jgi:hypothetical protein
MAWAREEESGLLGIGTGEERVWEGGGFKYTLRNGRGFALVWG